MKVVHPIICLSLDLLVHFMRYL